MLRIRIVPIGITLVACLSAPGLAAQTPQPATPASCDELLTGLERKISENYAGLSLEITGARRVEYDRAVRRLHAEASATRTDACYPVLTRLTDWFDDPHLFVYQSARIDTAETSRRAKTVAMQPMEEAAARDYFSRNAARLDPIEGIWYDVGLRMAVVPERNAPAGRFVAIVLTSDTTIWPRGAVRARFVRRPNGSYATTIWGRNFVERSLTGDVYKRVLLRMSPGTWGKEFPVAAADRGLLHPDDPRRPTLQVRGRTVVVSLPSHDPSFAPYLDSLVASNAEALRAADRLIVDLRGNEGGSSWMSDPLMPYVRSARRRPDAYGVDDGALLSSADQIVYARRAFGSDTSRFVRSLVGRMRERPGELVPMSDPAEAAEPERPDSLVPGSRRVGVLIDRGTVSAAEVFVLRALRSERATVFGDNTAGALDYQSTNIVPIAANERRWYLGYPTITRIIPPGGKRMRGIGIPPDVRVDWRTIADPIGYVERALTP